jgi:FkbH-like protein
LKVSEALRIVQKAPQDAPPFGVLLACGFAPLYLKTLLHAHLQQALSTRLVSISEGLYGDLAGTLERDSAVPLEAIVVALEWADLDSRLGFRSSARWSPAAVADILQVAESSLQRIEKTIGGIAPGVRIALSLPTLPLPPLFPAAAGQASEAELLLDQKLAAFSASVSRRAGLSIVHAGRLAGESPLTGRFDLKSELLIGFPYTVTHADALAASYGRLLAPPAIKKGIITDLDDTLWNGIVGEEGPEGVSWDFAKHHQLHALYQNLLSSLAAQGVLVGIASKNDAQTVQKTFERSDILLKPESVFPLEVHWGAKSASIGRILETWNIAADSVVFVDDSPMELAEAAALHSGLHCLRFPTGDYAAGLALLTELRDLCGKPHVSHEDSLRLASIRQNAELRTLAEDGTVPESFLELAQATVTLDFCPPPEDGRVLELVNKTNQFNLNGLRRTEADWRSTNQKPGSVAIVISYEDKFGPLGKIAVLQGHRQNGTLHVGTWVMSCRAFSRRIEHQCLRVLFDRLGVTDMQFDFTPTPKNGPCQDFFETLLTERPKGAFPLTRQQFEAACPQLFHRVVAQNT